MKVRVLFALVPFALSCGCSDSGGRLALRGSVSLDGEPLADGAISFRPLAGTKGPAAGGDIVDGHFSIRAQDGTFSGKFRVEIRAMRKTRQQDTYPITGETFDIEEQYLPLRYNEQSELEREVTADGPNDFKFDLQQNE